MDGDYGINEIQFTYLGIKESLLSWVLVMRAFPHSEFYFIYYFKTSLILRKFIFAHKLKKKFWLQKHPGIESSFYSLA